METTATQGESGAPAHGLSRVRKRDGRVTPFCSEKIARAIEAAGRASEELDPGATKDLTLRVLSVLACGFEHDVPTVEQIQDVVEDVLLSSRYKKTAKAFILYREQRARMRELVSQADVELVDAYLQKKDWQVSENSNMAYSLQGLNNYISSEISKVYWLTKIYPREIRGAHTDGDLHLHDLNLLSVYCVGWDLYDLLLCGFRGAPGKAESGPARHFRTALGQIVNFFYTLQGEAAGAQAFSSFDTLLAPFVRCDGLSEREVEQALQEFVFNLNVPTRVGFQTPFTNITLDLKVSPNYAEQAVIVGGELQDACYGEFQREMDMINRAFFRVLARGDAKGRVFTFPIPTVNVGPDFEWGSENLEPLWEATARYGIPYFSNYVGSDMSPEDARSMCCRLRLDLKTLARRGGGLFGAHPLTGSIGVVTINMPRLGYLAETEDDFLGRLARLMDLARDSLEIKRKELERFTDENLYPYTRFYLRAIKESRGEYWFNHFGTVGLVGLNEACLNLFQKDIGTHEGRAFAVRVLDFMRSRLERYQQETGHLYNLEATPAEGAGFRLAQIDAERYPGLVNGSGCSGGKPFYNNSSQLPVNYSDDVFEVLDLQDDIQSRYTGGTVLHIYSGEAQADARTVESFVRTVCKNYSLPYFTFTPTFSICPEHGYRGGEHGVCPDCGRACEVYSRVVGYLRPLSQWNEGKAEEFSRRSSFDITGRQG